MHRTLVAGMCVLYLGIANCANGPTEPNGRALLGRWAAVEGEPIVLAADSAATILQVGCATIRTEKLVALTEDGKFTFQGDYRVSFPPAGNRIAKVVGHVQGNTVVLTYDILKDGQSPTSVALQHGVEPPAWAYLD